MNRMVRGAMGATLAFLCCLALAASLSCSGDKNVPVFVMLQLNTVGNSGNLNNPQQLHDQLQKLKSAKVEGVMVDAWFGIVELQENHYNWKPYQTLADMCSNLGLKLHLVMSFHQCGGNTGDACDIPLPPWVLAKEGIWYTDNEGNENKEYISLFADHLPVFEGGRTPVQVYADYIKSFSETFKDHIGSTVTGIEVSLGPAGEMRYPSYPLSRWTFCGVGEFQCYDRNAVTAFANYSASNGHPEWNAPPSNAGGYNDRLGPNTPFFNDGGYNSDYGRWFLEWYSDALLAHGYEILSSARKSVPASSGCDVTAKVAGIHWWYKSPSHPAELTAGYYNTNGNDAYGDISKMFAKVGVSLDFTCLEMQDSAQEPSCECGPFELVEQVQHAAFSNGVDFVGENALPRYDETAYSTIEARSCYNGKPIKHFTYLRLCNTLLSSNNFNTFGQFVDAMSG